MSKTLSLVKKNEIKNGNPKQNDFISIHSVLNVPYKAETWHA